MSDSAPIEIVADAPLHHPDARWVSLQLAGVVVFSELVYDTDADGNRTEERAVENFVRLLASRLRAALEGER